MNNIKLFVLISFAAIFSAQASQQPSQPPVVVTCTPITHDPVEQKMKPPFVAVGKSCAEKDKQAACDAYQNLPAWAGYGPSKATKCKTYKPLWTCSQITDDIKNNKKASAANFVWNDIKQANQICGANNVQMSLDGGTPDNPKKGSLIYDLLNNKWPGQGGSVVLCKSRTKQNVYGVQLPAGSDCTDTDSKNAACQVDLGFSDPVGCQSFLADPLITDFLLKYPEPYGITCKTQASGLGYRVRVPECSDTVKNMMCPKYTTFESCQPIALVPSEMDAWTKDFINKAVVTCKNKKFNKTYKKPALDCSQDTQKDACEAPIEEPVGCKTHESLVAVLLDIAGKSKYIKEK